MTLIRTAVPPLVRDPASLPAAGTTEAGTVVGRSRPRVMSLGQPIQVWSGPRMKYRTNSAAISHISGCTLAPLADDDLQDHVEDDARADARGDRVRERHQDDREERRDGDLVALPVDAGHLRDHEEADDDERGGRGLRRDDLDQRREERREQERDAGDDGREARARTLADAGRGLDVARVARDARGATGRGGDRVDDEDLLRRAAGCPSRRAARPRSRRRPSCPSCRRSRRAAARRRAGRRRRRRSCRSSRTARSGRAATKSGDATILSGQSGTLSRSRSGWACRRRNAPPTLAIDSTMIATIGASRRSR